MTDSAMLCTKEVELNFACIFVTDCTNQFVMVKYNSEFSIITCTFVNQFDNSEKSCAVMNGQCNNQTKMTLASKISNTSTITLEFKQGGTFCIAASNGNYTVMVERRAGMYIAVYH